MSKAKTIEIEKDPQKIEELKKEMSGIGKTLYFLASIFLGNGILILLLDNLGEDNLAIRDFFKLDLETYNAYAETIEMVLMVLFLFVMIYAYGQYKKYYLIRSKLGIKGFDKFSAGLYSLFLKQTPNERSQFPRVFIIHGWGGNPEEAWIPWLKKQLEIQGIEVHALSMPDTEHPKIENWVPYLTKEVKVPDRETYFVGHSIGVQTILRLIEVMDMPVGGVVAVAGFYKLIPGSLDGPEEEEIAKPWLETDINNSIVRKNIGQITAIFSDNDKFVGLENADLFKKNLGAKTIVLHNKGHLGANDNVQELPEVLAAIEEIIKVKGINQ